MAITKVGQNKQEQVKETTLYYEELAWRFVSFFRMFFSLRLGTQGNIQLFRSINYSSQPNDAKETLDVSIRNGCWASSLARGYLLSNKAEWETKDVLLSILINRRVPSYRG
jgi:hypothetical protein